ncbi:acyl-CoA synthetase/AMP-acid ligase-like protein II [Elsinoe ampelina]|uniref:Acyl-CoA synthetase/AMP-acid ligase-like protein II n=1 Tax=Elsinoe ampelina TaxID=302913 RepID=A0A6A6GEP5_9PEZI|nr:acyl-CoA synthetase/AMP-acid ligase-like protein II [Elsinoe ampelina]
MDSGHWGGGEVHGGGENDARVEPPLIEETIDKHFASIVRENGDRNAVISRHQSTTLTYRDLDEQSNALARGLLERGVKKGDRVAVSLGNGIEFAVTTYALFKIGAILVPLNPAFNAQQVVAALGHLTASHLIIGLETNLPFKPPRSNVPLLTHIVPDTQSRTFTSALLPSLQSIIIVDNTSSRISPSSLPIFTPFPSLSASQPTSPLPPQTLLNTEIANIQFTSGTTSTPKAACLTHRSILNNGHSIGARMLLTPSDIVVCPPPLFHCFGCILGYMATATHGSTIVFPSEAFSPTASLLAVQENQATALYGVPTMFLAELDLLATGKVAARRGFDRLRTGIAAGSSVPAELMRKLHRELGLTELTICYGMTETSPVSAMTTTDDPLVKRVETVGRLLPHVSAKVVEPGDRDRIVGVGERGELAVAGYLVMQGYWGDEARTKEVMVEDEEGKVWMHTGDEAEMDADGYVRITGRIKDLIIRGGENIHPLEVESCVLEMEGVLDASVVGIGDERYGEVVGAFVVRKEGREVSGKMVREHVRQRLSGHLVPKYVFFVDGYPKTASGKIQKFKLREMGVEMVREGKGLE